MEKKPIDIKWIITKSGNKKSKIGFYTHTAGRGGWSEWVYPTEKYFFKCCDCGLVHEMEFRTLIKKKTKGLYFQAIQLPKEIAVMFRARRYKNKKVVSTNPGESQKRR